MDEKNMPNLLDILEFLKFPDKKHLLEFSDTDTHSTFTKDDIFFREQVTRILKRKFQ